LLETIMVQNSSIYDELEKYMNDNLSPQTHVYDAVHCYHWGSPLCVYKY
jgi:hypothetical protein